jgi:hypothetical protein
VGLGLECCCHLQVAREIEELLLEIVCECGITITDNGAREVGEVDDVGAESTRHRGRRVWVVQLNEMGIFSEAVHHCQDG